MKITATTEKDIVQSVQIDLTSSECLLVLKALHKMQFDKTVNVNDRSWARDIRRGILNVFDRG